MSPPPEPIDAPRLGQAGPQLTRTEFVLRFRRSFADPAFGAAQDALQQVESIAWDAYSAGRKTP